MNTTEQIVEAYFRVVRKCFTMTDVKVQGGNNRQMDLLAYDIKKGEQYHVEIGVTHVARWNPTLDQLKTRFDHKFLGMPREREGPRTDFARGKEYLTAIKRTYREVGFDPRKVQRIYICWTPPHDADFEAKLLKYCRLRRLGKNPIRVVGFRDVVLYELMQATGTSNYDDPLLRIISLLKQYQVQRAAALGHEPN